MDSKIKLTEITNFLDMESQYLKAALKFFSPELMEPYKDIDLDDHSQDERYVFPDTKETWKLISFAICNSFLEDITDASDKLTEVIDLLGVR